MLSTNRADWLVLLIGGTSGIGKTIAAESIGKRLGVSWLQVDDLRLALQNSQVALPEGTDALYFFEKTPDVWRLPPQQLCDGLIAVGRVMTPAIEIVIANHVDAIAPIVIEGDGILPSLFTRPSVQNRAVSGRVRAVFLIESDKDMLFRNMLARGRGISHRTEEELVAEAQAKWLYNQWLADEARQNGLSVVAPRPWATLVERIVAESRPRAISFRLLRR